MLHVKCRICSAGDSRFSPHPWNISGEGAGPVTQTRRTDLWTESERESEIRAAAVEDVRETHRHISGIFFSTSTEEQLPYMVKVCQAWTQSQHAHAHAHISLFSRERAGCMKGWWVISCVQEHTAVQFSHTAPEGPSAFVQTMWINIWTCSDDEYVSSGSFTLLLQRCQAFTIKREVTLKWDRQIQGI